MREHKSTQVLMSFPNGVEVSVITDGYGGPNLFEALVTHTPSGRGIPHLTHNGDSRGTYGWLDDISLGQLVAKVASLTNEEVLALRV